MSIRLKLLLSYAAMLIIPLVFIALISLLLVIVFRGDIHNMRDVYGMKAGMFEEHNHEQLLREVRRNAEENPSVFADSTYLAGINSELTDSGTSLAIRKNGSWVFTSDSLQQPSVVNQFAPFVHPGSHHDQTVKVNENLLYVVDQIDFAYPDREPGSLFIIKSENPVADFARDFFGILFVSIIIIFVLTHALLTYYVSKGIIGPLQLLKNAAKQIKEGNLDGSVQLSGKDEIAQLGTAFEEMRLQLRDSIKLQLQYEENRKELISNISHDLKTPLTAIKGYVEGILDGVADTPEKSRRYTQIISSKAEEMDRLIDELFLFSKLDLNRVPFAFECVDMHAFVEHLADELHFDLEKKGVVFDAKIELEPGLFVSADRDKLKRVFSNVIDNCLKYMDKPVKRIRLQASVDGGAAAIEIADNGQGIDPAALPLIFERFYRAEQSRSKQTGGSGLGLAIARQIVQGHGGEIRASSVEGEGTRITITLPVMHAEKGRA